MTWRQNQTISDCHIPGVTKVPSWKRSQKNWLGDCYSMSNAVPAIESGCADAANPLICSTLPCEPWELDCEPNCAPDCEQDSVPSLFMLLPVPGLSWKSLARKLIPFDSSFGNKTGLSPASLRVCFRPEICFIVALDLESSWRSTKLENIDSSYSGVQNLGPASS